MPRSTVAAARYVTPLREGGSLPAVVEGDDDGLYVLKFRGAGQGPKALIAELLAGELARMAGLAVPDIVLMTLDPALARTEPDPEIQELIRASAGLNLALDYLPGSVTFDPLVHPIDADLASAIVWIDAFVANVDRSARNANLLWWHGRVWLIDHGAALIYHHHWRDPAAQGRAPFRAIDQHLLLPWATRIAEADHRLSPRFTRERLAELVAEVPTEWLAADTTFADAAVQREAYVLALCSRLAEPRLFVEEAIRAAAAAVA